MTAEGPLFALLVSLGCTALWKIAKPSDSTCDGYDHLIFHDTYSPLSLAERTTTPLSNLPSHLPSSSHHHHTATSPPTTHHV